MQGETRGPESLKRNVQTGPCRPVFEDGIADVLEAEILDGTLKPNERLDERTLAERFGVSRSPVRDAIGRLSALGLVDVRPKSGTYVAEMSLSLVLHHFELMAGLEGLCARYARPEIHRRRPAGYSNPHRGMRAASGPRGSRRLFAGQYLRFMIAYTVPPTIRCWNRPPAGRASAPPTIGA